MSQPTQSPQLEDVRWRGNHSFVARDSVLQESERMTKPDMFEIKKGFSELGTCFEWLWREWTQRKTNFVGCREGDSLNQSFFSFSVFVLCHTAPHPSSRYGDYQFVSCFARYNHSLFVVLHMFEPWIKSLIPRFRPHNTTHNGERVMCADTFRYKWATMDSVCGADEFSVEMENYF